MNQEQPITQTEAQQHEVATPPQGQQPWRRPTLKRLRLSLDTAHGPGSLTDGFQTGSSTTTGPR
ncbi:MAG: hypothetical protein GXP41_01710 [Chloroflexi bacterium]|nr:hypothetical protein [Chloroflexota bacterium]